MSEDNKQTPTDPASQAAAAPAAPKLADGLFKPFTLGSRLAQGPTGNVMENVKEPMMDYEKVYQNSTKNQNISAEELAKLGVKKSKFKEVSAAIQRKEGYSKERADAITAAAGRKELGQKEMTRRAEVGKKEAKKSVEEMDAFYGMAENFQKALFNEKAVMAPSKKWEPSKEDLLNQLCYKIHDLKHLKDASWMIEEEVPGIKSLAEKKFEALKKDITGIAAKYKGAPSSK